MALPTITQKELKSIWENFSKNTLADDELDAKRLIAIEQLKGFLLQFFRGDINVFEFKTTVDSYNKRNNLWGFTAVKGQMFFNQLVRNNEKDIHALEVLLKKSLEEPRDLKDALDKIGKLEAFCNGIFSTATDKRKAPNPKSVGYFLSYFWQIHSPNKWPILYTSQIDGYKKLGIWEEKSSERENYEHHFKLNDEIKAVISNYRKKPVNNWDVEHVLWYYAKDSNYLSREVVLTPIDQQPLVASIQKVETIVRQASFEVADYLPPKAARLIELGNQTDVSSSAKGKEFEKLVAEIFRMLDFEVDPLGQGTGRNPDAIVKFSEEHTAFLVDAKAYSTGYSLGIDDRAIREYISHYCPKLNKVGVKKIGFVIVSNSFKSNFEDFANEITWNTDVKRFILLTSEALLHLLAYKTKDRINLSSIVECLVGLPNPITSQSIIEKFDDI